MPGPTGAQVDELLSPDTSRKEVEILWGALRSCYGTESEAVAAAARNTGTILPYLNSPSNIKGCYAVLVELMGSEQAGEVCAKNPGILQCNPRVLALEHGRSAVSGAPQLAIPAPPRPGPRGLRIWRCAHSVRRERPCRPVPSGRLRPGHRRRFRGVDRPGARATRRTAARRPDGLIHLRRKACRAMAGQPGGPRSGREAWGRLGHAFPPRPPARRPARRSLCPDLLPSA